ncbi:MAG TPA: carboxypeptidase-like regulatory domain-containing protein, partial [Saprospiraceae bacterium]|nr:carboxypeptidase-like regulatory domain-containing protein [Saprospiraceae bacterium]HPI05857.1 carboxypeptidase-like regulatory domain-containing protein [Saprospiraceae bacterium]
MKATGTILFVTILFFFKQALPAQTLYGQVTDMKNQPIPGAVVVWAGTSTGARTDDNGEYGIPLPMDTTLKPQKLAVVFQELRDTFSIDDFSSYWTLQAAATVTLKEVTVQDENTGAYISILQPVKVEVINRAELRKAACCDLAGCFETQSTVQPTT